MGLLKASSKPKPKGFSQTVWKKTANGKRRRVEVIRPLSLSPPPSPSTPRTPHKSSSVRSTPQSLAGAKRHQTQEPVGNWPELDDILEEAGFNEFDFSQFNLYGKVNAPSWKICYIILYEIDIGWLCTRMDATQDGWFARNHKYGSIAPWANLHLVLWGFGWYYLPLQPLLQHTSIMQYMLLGVSPTEPFSSYSNLERRPLQGLWPERVGSGR